MLRSVDPFAMLQLKPKFPTFIPSNALFLTAKGWRIVWACAVLAGVSPIWTAFAQTYPAKPIKLWVGFPPAVAST